MFYFWKTFSFILLSSEHQGYEAWCPRDWASSGPVTAVASAHLAVHEAFANSQFSGSCQLVQWQNKGMFNSHSSVLFCFHSAIKVSLFVNAFVLAPKGEIKTHAKLGEIMWKNNKAVIFFLSNFYYWPGYDAVWNMRLDCKTRLKPGAAPNENIFFSYLISI